MSDYNRGELEYVKINKRHYAVYTNYRLYRLTDIKLLGKGVNKGWEMTGRGQKSMRMPTLYWAKEMVNLRYSLGWIGQFTFLDL